MNKYNVIFPHNGKVFGNKKGMKYTYMLQRGWILKTLLSEISMSQNTVHCMIQFI